MLSLQRRVIVGGLIWAVLATTVGGFALVSVFDQIANRRFNEALREQHTQVLIALATVEDPTRIEELVVAPAYRRVYSGRYWQINNDEGDIYTSPSLFDVELNFDAGKAGIWNIQGPQAMVRGYSEQVALESGEVWTVSVAASLDALAAERAEMQRFVTLAFGLVGALGVACAALLTTVLVAPLRKLRDDVTHRWDAGKALNTKDYPTEVAPLVDDINELIARNRSILDKGRRQAADLAHALKTPSAALRNELVTLSKTTNGTAPMFEALDRIDAQIIRSLARMRASSAAEAVDVKTDVAHSIGRLERLFRAAPHAEDKRFDTQGIDAFVAIDPQDFEEMLGNLLENAFKFAVAHVRLRAEQHDTSISITVEDDGPGIPEKQRENVLEEGARLDTSVPGTGLGLSIVNDLSQAYGGALTLETSRELGGLQCVLRLPIAHLKLERTEAKTAKLG